MKPSRPIGRKNYGSIPHLSNSKLGDGDYFIGEGQEQILTLKKRDKHDIIIVSEKYDWIKMLALPNTIIKYMH